METIRWNLKKEQEQALREAGKLLAAGEVVAFPTETVYGLGADGLNGEAVKKIFAAKGRPVDNPLILHIADKNMIYSLASELSPLAEKLADSFWPGPLTMVVKKADSIPDEVTAGLDTVAVRMPGHPVAAALIREAGCPVAAPSANISGKPSPTNADDVAEDMMGKIAGILDGGPCGIGVESTVVDTTGECPVILRPGGITKEMLESLVGKVELDPALNGNPALKPKAPGMKYRHYAPLAPLFIVEGKTAGREIIRLMKKAAEESVKLCVISDDITLGFIKENSRRQEEVSFLSWGEGKEDLAEHLYELLRECDRIKPDFIITTAVDEKGMGLAVMNRLKKSAAYNILVADEDGLSVKSGTNFPPFVLK